jgi:hypothetical protein
MGDIVMIILVVLGMMNIVNMNAAKAAEDVNIGVKNGIVITLNVLAVVSAVVECVKDGVQNGIVNTLNVLVVVSAELVKDGVQNGIVIIMNALAVVSAVVDKKIATLTQEECVIIIMENFMENVVGLNVKAVLSVKQEEFVTMSGVILQNIKVMDIIVK